MAVLGVFAKWPEPGRVKTRLGLAADVAARAAEAFLRDTLDRGSAVAARRVVVFAPADAGERFAGLVPPGWACEPQADGDLGDRLTAFFARHLPTGEAVVAIGADSPTLPVEYIREAVGLLGDADVVLGPACDGGYYLVGLRGELPPLFTGIDWSTAGVLAQTIAALAEPRWRVRLLSPWYDVDTPADWGLLRGHVAAMRRAGVEPGVPHTEAVLRSHATSSRPGSTRS